MITHNYFREHYEGTLVAVMYSTDDDMVGYKACGDKILSSIKGSDYTVVVSLNVFPTVNLETAEKSL